MHLGVSKKIAEQDSPQLAGLRSPKKRDTIYKKTNGVILDNTSLCWDARRT